MVKPKLALLAAAVSTFPGTSAQSFGCKDGSEAILLCRERNYNGVCTANANFISTDLWNFPEDLKSGPLSMKWVAFGQAANE
ncbi:hypothetical protein AX774_g3768 [Zancudomyces culisetae]|uniref:Uncharacterized protein n=1 Tax=Zancudomyces culisetae TaxID=1213189 RepID=A0A1R1PP52_ZANCU|nr:hypothetical protein AX774_g3768 [Zancudomyces culisetae]|eukprot:OMH82747.1 hypothetical protein AX774_g3768 [Zancudomyces culisetae]